MKIDFRVKSTGRTSGFRLLLLVFLMLILAPQMMRAETKIEEAMRKLNGRCYFVDGYKNCIRWLPDNCIPAPFFPKDGFYGDLDKNKTRAVELVQDLATKFYSKAIFTSYYKTADGSENIIGESTPGGGYSPTDFPKTGTGFNLEAVTDSTYPKCIEVLNQYIEKIQYYVVAPSWIYASTNGEGGILDRKEGTGTSWTLNCPDARSEAADNWNAYDSPFPNVETYNTYPNIYVSASSYETPEVNVISHLHSLNGKLFYDSAGLKYLTTGSLRIYLKIAPASDGIGANNPPGISSPTVANNTYQLYGTVGLTAGQKYTSASAFTATPVPPNDCSDPPTVHGWSTPKSGPYGLLKPDFKTDPDGMTDCSGCADCNKIPGVICLKPSSLGLSISLGADKYGKSAGSIYIQTDKINDTLFTPAAFGAATSDSVSSVSYDGGGLLSSASIPNSDVAATVSTNGSGYSISFTKSSSPVSSVSVSFASMTNTITNRITIVETIGGNSRTFHYDYAKTSDSVWGWTLLPAGGVRQEARTSTLDGSGNRTDVVAKIGTNTGTAKLIREKYALLPSGKLLTQLTEGTNSSERTTTWHYYGYADGASKSNKVGWFIEPTGKWTHYDYNSDGRLSKVVRQFGDNATNTSGTSDWLTEYSYDSSYNITTVEKLLNTEIARSYDFHSVDGSGVERIQYIQCATSGAATNAADNLTNIVWRATSTYSGTYYLATHEGDTLQTSNANGTMSFHGYYFTNSGALKITIVDAGVPNSGLTAIVDGTRTITSTGLLGEMVTNTVVDIASGVVIDQQIYTYSGGDTFKRSPTITYLDGTTEQYDYDCCGLSSRTDRHGVTTVNHYDGAHRLVGTTSLGITQTNLLDGDGRVLKTIRTGTNGSSMQILAGSYDLAGFLINETNALGGVTTHAWTTNGSGQRILTTTFDDGGTSVTTNYMDGSVFKVGGTAVPPRSYVYGVDDGKAFTAERRLDSSGGTNEWTKSYTDMLGRNFKTVYAGTGTPTAMSYFNVKGQLTNQVDPDGVSTMFVYNTKGEQTHAVVNVDQDSDIDESGPDRITFTTNDVTTTNSINVRRSRTFVTTGSGTSNLVSMRLASVDGLKTWNIIWNGGDPVTNRTVTANTGAYRYVTNFMPNGAYVTTTFQSNRLVSVTEKDTNNNQVTLTSYGHDAFGRQNTATNARTGGTTTNFFNTADLVNGTGTPSPGGGQSSQITEYFYDGVLRMNGTKFPDNAVVTNVLGYAGLPKQNYGARTYPAGHGYDAQGRVKTMTNWSGFAGNSGPRVTTWNYDQYRGWLSSKAYDDSSAITYGYSYAGRLTSRAWARGTNTTYVHGGAGDLASAAYNDGATSSVINGYDRLGQLVGISNNNVVTKFTFNDAGQLTGEVYSNGPLANFYVTNVYDQFLRRIKVGLYNNDTPLLWITNSYDAAGRLSAFSDTTNSATYAYLTNSSLVSNIVFKSNSTTRLTTTKNWDNVNRLASISNSIGLAYTYGYNAANQRTSMTINDPTDAFADGVYWSYEYDSFGQVVSGRKYLDTDEHAAGQQFGYSFDDIGNRLTTLQGGDQYGRNRRLATYSPNNRNQYTSRTVPSAVDIIGWGNYQATLTVNTNTKAVWQYANYFRAELPVTNTSAAVWQPVNVLGVINGGDNNDYTQAIPQGHLYVPKTPESFTYDADGNLTSDGRFTNVWDGENRLISITSLTNTPTASKIRLGFGYDYMGRRVSKKVENYDGTNWSVTLSNLFVYDGWNLIAELNASNNALIRSYVWGSDLSGSQQGAGGVGGLISMTIHTGTNSGTYFPCYDGNGNVTALVRAVDGAVVARYEYGPFGELIRANGPLAQANPFLFSTKHYDWEAGVYYFGYRYYNSSTGRWLNRDPMEESGGRNLYGYSGNDPIDRFDPLGLFSLGAEFSGEIIILAGPTPIPGVGYTVKVFGESSIFECCGTRGSELWGELELGIDASITAGGAFKGKEKAPNSRGSKYRSSKGQRRYVKGPKKGDKEHGGGAYFDFGPGPCPEKSGCTGFAEAYITGSAGLGLGGKFNITFEIHPKLQYPKFDARPGFYIGASLSIGAKGGVDCDIRLAESVSLF